MCASEALFAAFVACDTRVSSCTTHVRHVIYSHERHQQLHLVATCHLACMTSWWTWVTGFLCMYRGSSSQAAVANRAAAVTQSFQLRPSSANQPPAPRRAAPAAAAPLPPALAAAPAAAPTDGVQMPKTHADAMSDMNGSHRQAPQTSSQGLPSQSPGLQSNQQQQQGNVKQAGNGQQQQQQQLQAPQQQTLNLHQSDVYSPLQASAPYQVSVVIVLQQSSFKSSLNIKMFCSLCLFCYTL